MQSHQETIFDRRGNVVPNCLVSVTTLDGTLVPLWADNGITPLPNPMTSNEEGQVNFHAANGHYNIKTIREGVEVDQRMDVTLFDPDDLQALDQIDVLYFTAEGATLLDGVRSVLRPAASATPASNGELVFELPDDTQLKIKVRGSDGIVRSVTLNLS